MNKAPSLLERVSQVRREEELEEKSFLDERWDRLAAGKLTEAENDELLGLADASGEAHEKYQAFKPLGPAFEKNLVASIRAQQQAEREERTADLPALADSGPEPAVKKRGAFTWAFGAIAPMMAMVLALLLVPADPFGEVTTADLVPKDERRGVPLPATPDGPPRYRPDDYFDLKATTDLEPGDEIEARLFVLGTDGKLRATRIVPKLKGSLEITFNIVLLQNLTLAEGRWRLVAVYARPGKFPDEKTILEAALEGARRARDWQVAVKQVIIEETH